MAGSFNYHAFLITERFGTRISGSRPPAPAFLLPSTMFLVHLPLGTNRLHCLGNTSLESCLCSFVHLNHPLHISDPVILISLHEAVRFPFAFSFPRGTLSIAYCVMSSVSTSSEAIMSTELLANYCHSSLHVCICVSSFPNETGNNDSFPGAVVSINDQPTDQCKLAAKELPLRNLLECRCLDCMREEDLINLGVIGTEH
ncbi:protein FAM106C-like [Symphalangus syndactylus]|uniref:protein FAM106C-like n=1 Tax=Symphalangus syndactylus TaxID=9590 RepID=UPI002443410D|nr:protein FAM106C-like [Symphalangus syndactylus]